MKKKLVLVSLLFFLALATAFSTADATTIPSATLDKTTYLAGQTGYISVSVYNDKSEKIRVTELSASINYYYTDNTIYIQKFFTSTTLPDEIPAGETKTYSIPISLPTNIAAGYTSPWVEAKTDVWRPQDDRWATSDHPNYTSLKLYIESPYKQLYETSQQQLDEQEAANQNLNSTVTMLAATALVFATVAAFLGFYTFSRRARTVQQQL